MNRKRSEIWVEGAAKPTIKTSRTLVAEIKPLMTDHVLVFER
jgi:hypothetical protein